MYSVKWWMLMAADLMMVVVRKGWWNYTKSLVTQTTCVATSFVLGTGGWWAIREFCIKLKEFFKLPLTRRPVSILAVLLLYPATSPNTLRYCTAISCYTSFNSPAIPLNTCLCCPAIVLYTPPLVYYTPLYLNTSWLQLIQPPSTVPPYLFNLA